MSCYTGKCIYCPVPCWNPNCEWKTNDIGLWNTLKEQFLDYKIDGTMYKAVKQEDGTYDFESFDDGISGCRANYLGLKFTWILEGWHECRKMRRSKKRKMRKLVQKRLRALEKKYKKKE